MRRNARARRILRGALGSTMVLAAALAVAAPGAWAVEQSAGAHGSAAHATEGSSGAREHGAGEHHQEFNWYHGIIGEKDGVEPSLLWRAPGTPAPFAAQLLNTLILFGLIVRFAKVPVGRGLLDRRQRIMRGIEDAAAMQKEATEQLAVYRHKLDNLDAEIERVRREMREAAEAERRRALEDAAARRVRLEQEARVLIERELADLREQLRRETALAALRSARELLQRNVATEDHRRLCDEYLQGLQPAGGHVSGAHPGPSQPVSLHLQASYSEVQRPSDPVLGGAARRSDPT